MDKLNSMCTTCARLGNDCKGTTCQTWTGCTLRPVPFDTYHGFSIYEVGKNLYVAKGKRKTLTAENLHDIYAKVYLEEL